MYDVIVVGAGPAGSSAARRCTQLGLNTLLIDKAIFPRDKLCGGALSEYAMACLDFGLEEGILECDIYGARLHFRGRAIEVKKPSRLAATVSRAAFDNFLLKKAQEAGTTIALGRRVAAVRHTPDGIVIIADKDNYEGRIVIGCDGFYSVIARAVRPMDQKNEYALCIETHVTADDATIAEYNRGAVDLHLGNVRGGYGWVFPHRGYFSVGIGEEAGYVSDLRGALGRFMASVGLDADARIQGYPIPAGGVRRKIVADRILLAGDAAGFVDAFYGEGIGYAIRSGQLAAEAAFRAITQGQCSELGLKSYVMVCEREFGKSLHYSLLLARLMHRFPGIFFKLMTSNVEAVDRYLEIPARRQTYGNYFRWLLLHFPLLWAEMMRQPAVSYSSPLVLKKSATADRNSER